MSRAIKRRVAAAVLCALFGSGAASAASITRTSSFAYDAASGQPIQEVVEPDTPAMRLETDYSYDAFGNKLSSTVSGADIVSRASSSTYDAGGRFVTGNSNGLGQSESFQTDARFGQPTSQTGPNGLTTSWSYDGFGRKTQEIRPDGTQTKWSYQYCSGVNGGTATCPAGATFLIQATPYAADGTTINGPTTTVYFDILKRDIATDTQGFDGRTVRETKTYDALGRISQASRPYFLSGGAPQQTTITYDVMGRPLTQTKPDGSVSQVAYHGLAVTKTNALNQTRSTTKDSQGNVVAVTDALGKTMTYAYDPFGNLVQTTDPVGNVVTASYDRRGNKIASSDPDLGTWSYTYNTLGLLITQTNANGQTTTLTYDQLDRVVQQVEPDMTSVWVYDTAAHGIGKPASTSITAGPGSGYARSVSYDGLGRPVQAATSIDGATYALGATYDANGRLIKVSYPSGFTARYAYTNLGDTSQLLDDATGQAYWTANAFDAEQRLTQQTAGNGLVTTDSFDALTGRLTATTTGSGGAVQNLGFTYDKGGNPLSRSDANTSLSESFTYDALKRLTSSTVNLSPTPLSKTFSYDPIGNMLSKSDVGSYSYPAAGSALPHAVTSVSGGSISATFTYDANGNQTGGLGRSIVYTSYNKPASITQGTRTISFLDDTDHQRFKQVTPEGSTLYISAFGVLTELSNPGAAGQKWTDYLSVGSAQIGMRVLQTATATLSTRYFHTDPLGSISVISNESGQVVERLSYDAWGKRRNPNGTDDPTGSIVSQSTRGFTGEEELSVAGLVHLNGRVYDPTLARMTSADPDVSRPMSTQGWNRYAYVGNRPLRSTDPSGFQDYTYPGFNYLNEFDLPAWPPYAPPQLNFGQQNSYMSPPVGSISYVVPAPLPIVTPLPQFDINAMWASINANVAAMNATLAAQQAAIQAQFNAMQSQMLAAGDAAYAAALASARLATQPPAAIPISDKPDAPRPLFSPHTLAETWAEGIKIYSPLMDQAPPGVIPLGAMGGGARAAGPKGVDALKGGSSARGIGPTVGELRAAGLKDAHHIIQDAAVRDLNGYSTNAAPGVVLEGPSNLSGTAHNLATAVQRQAGGGTYASERRIGYEALRRGGLSQDEARSAIGRADSYFESIGVTLDTITRIPGNR